MSDLALHYYRQDKGIPLVLLPAFPLDGRMWRYVVAELDGWVITVDPPGFGDSVNPRVITARHGRVPEPSIETYAHALAAALDEVHAEKAAIVGMSMGGYTAMAFAELYPERVAGIGLIDTRSTADTLPQQEDRLRMADYVSGDITQSFSPQLAPLLENVMSPWTKRHKEHIYETLASWFEQAPAAGIAWGQRAMAGRPDRTAVLKRLDVPAVVARGVDDSVTSYEEHGLMAQALGVAVQEIENAGHLSAVEAPRRVAMILDEMWQEARARDSAD